MRDYIRFVGERGEVKEVEEEEEEEESNVTVLIYPRAIELINTGIIQRRTVHLPYWI